MMVDKSVLKRFIDKSAVKDLLILTVNGYEKNSLRICQKEIEGFLKNQEDNLIIVIRR